MSGEIALFCLLHPGSAEKKDRVISLLRSSYDYRESEAQCTTWCYFTHSPRKGAASQIVDAAGSDGKSLIVAGMEIYTNKSALSTQLEHPKFKSYHSTAKAEDLYARPEELVAWYPAGGFVARDKTAPPYGRETTVMIAKFILKESDGNREKGLEILRPFAEWVKTNESDVLTYCIMTRPKGPNEILMFERYKNLAVLKSHGSSKQFKTMFTQIKPLVAGTIMNEWQELDGSFVGTAVGGGGSTSKL